MAEHEITFSKENIKETKETFGLIMTKPDVGENDFAIILADVEGKL